ncbi:MAG: helix-turn-helix domain-containing protein, partial [Ktedonobacteraceae bacterium]
MYRLKIKEIAESKGYNISTLSRAADVPFNTLRRAWRNPQYEIKLATLHKIAQVLGVTRAKKRLNRQLGITAVKRPFRAPGNMKRRFL